MPPKLMKAEDLRIGNWVQPEVEENFFDVMEVLTITQDGSDLKGFKKNIHKGYVYGKFGTFKPIPLNEEEFLKLGFEHNLEGLSKTEGRQTIFIPRYNKGDDFYVLYQEDIGCGFNPLRYVEYVHEIQNIWHSLTGSELTIKELVK